MLRKTSDLHPGYKPADRDSAAQRCATATMNVEKVPHSTTPSRELLLESQSRTTVGDRVRDGLVPCPRQISRDRSLPAPSSEKLGHLLHVLISAARHIEN